MWDLLLQEGLSWHPPCSPLHVDLLQTCSSDGVRQSDSSMSRIKELFLASLLRLFSFFL